MKEKNNIETNVIISLVLAIIAWTSDYIGIIFGIISLIFYLNIKDKTRIESKIIFWIALLAIIYRLFFIIIFILAFFSLSKFV